MSTNTLTYNLNQAGDKLADFLQEIKQRLFPTGKNIVKTISNEAKIVEQHIQNLVPGNIKEYYQEKKNALAFQQGTEFGGMLADKITGWNIFENLEKSKNQMANMGWNLVEKKYGAGSDEANIARNANPTNAAEMIGEHIKDKEYGLVALNLLSFGLSEMIPKRVFKL